MWASKCQGITTKKYVVAIVAGWCSRSLLPLARVGGWHLGTANGRERTAMVGRESGQMRMQMRYCLTPFAAAGVAALPTTNIQHLASRPHESAFHWAGVPSKSQPCSASTV
jgi:hypothetical protein